MSASQVSLPVAAKPGRRNLSVESLIATRWGGLLIPSLTDLLVVAAVVWLFLASPAGWLSLLADGDTGWHIRTGQWILAHHTVPTHDLFSYSKQGAPWFAWEWLTDVLYALLFQAAGLKGILLLSAALIAAFVGLLMRFAMWRGANALVAGAVILLSVGCSTIHFLARPHLFTLVFLPASLWILERDRRRPSSAVWLLIPLTALWTNLHGGWPIFMVCLALFVIGLTAENWLAGKSLRPALRYAGLLAGCGLATFVNPYGLELHKHILEYLRSDWIREHIQEFLAPTFRSEGEMQFEILLFAGLLVAGALLRRREITGALWILFLGHSALTSVRHAPLFAAVAGPLIAAEVSLWFVAWSSPQRRSSLPRILYEVGKDLAPSCRRSTFWPVFTLLVIALLPSIKWPDDFPRQYFPADFVKAHPEAVISGRLLTTDQWGDYLIFHLYPKIKVFVDGRSDFYAASIGGDYFKLLQGSWEWHSILARYGFDRALLPAEWVLCGYLKASPEWQLVSDNGKELYFVRRQNASSSGLVPPSTPALPVLKNPLPKANENLPPGRRIK